MLIFDDIRLDFRPQVSMMHRMNRIEGTTETELWSLNLKKYIEDIDKFP